MSAPTVSFVGIVPIADHEDANRIAWAFSYQPEDGDTFSIKLTSNGSTQTHAAFVQSATDGFVALMAAGRRGQIPSLSWADFGLTADRVAQVMSAMVMDTKPLADLIAAREWLQDHLAAVCAEHDPPLTTLETAD